jgi:hypothetical protein
MPRFSSILILAAALAVGALVACNDNHVTGPPAAPTTPNASLGGPIGSYFLGVPPSGYNAPNDGAMADRGTGIIIPAYSRVVITVTGNVTATPNPDYLCCFEQTSTAYAGSWGPGGVGQAPAYYLRVKLGGGPTITLHYGDSTATSDTIGAPSYDFELHVSRNGVNGGAGCYSNPLPGYPPGCTCPDGPCLQYSAPAYQLSGGQTITVTRINDHLQLTASRSVLTNPDSVTFTASTDNGASFTVQGWSWKSDSAAGDQTAACTGSGNPCTTTVYRSGTMTVRAAVGGATRTASAHVTVTPDSAMVTADSVDGVVGRTVTFHAGTRFGSPFTVVGWHWVPDSGIVASVVGKRPGRPALNRRNARVSAMGKKTAVSRDGTSGLPECVGSTDSTCQEVITESGTMYVTETIAGVSQTAGVHVTAQPDSLRINPSGKSLDPGNTATFQATTSTTPFTVTAWTWNGVAPTNGHALTNLSACTAGSTSCTGEFYESGTLTCEAVMNGVTVLASATVTVTPCAATGDSILDSPEVRTQMLDELAASNPSATPGTGVKHERFDIIFRRGDGSYYVKYVPDSLATECVSFVRFAAGDSAGDVPVAIFHTHPSNTNELVYGCPSDTLSNGVVLRYAQRRGDGGALRRANPNANGGGSVGDWETARSTGYDVYIVGKDGHHYKLPHDTTQVPRGQESSNPNVWHRKDKMSICLRHGP